MDMISRGVKDAGKIEDERVVIDVLADTNLGNYITSIVRETGAETISSKMISPVWFPSISVKTGDKVVVYSRNGERGKKSMTTGGTVYFFYRNCIKPLCDDARKGVLLMSLSDWNFCGDRA